MARLQFLHGDLEGRVCEIGDGKVSLGREGSNQIVVGDLTVSRRHCELLIYGPEVIVRDLGSSNGTSVEGCHLHGAQTQVLDGQILQFGLVAARLQLEPPRTERGATTAVLEYRDHMKTLAEGIPAVPPVKWSFTVGGSSSANSGGNRTRLLEWLQPVLRPRLSHLRRTSTAAALPSAWPTIILSAAIAAALLLALALAFL
jgi:hypothetical protein